METIKLMPLVVIAMFAAVLLYGLVRSHESEHRALLSSAERDRRLRDLTRRLALHPVAVRSVRRRGINERFLIDLGDEEVDVRCFWPPRVPIEHLVGITHRDDVGWILDVDGPSGRGRVYAWLLDVRPH